MVGNKWGQRRTTVGIIAALATIITVVSGCAITIRHGSGLPTNELLVNQPNRSASVEVSQSNDNQSNDLGLAVRERSETAPSVMEQPQSAQQVASTALSPSAEEIIAQLGQEKALPHHLADGDEYTLPLSAVLTHGQRLFTASWTPQDGGGRPMTKGTGAPLSDDTKPLVFPNNFNRISGPDANACSGCHNLPFGIPGGGGDIVANVFVLGQRFDFATFDGNDLMPLRGTVDELGETATLQTIANSRATPGLFGSGFIEMLARQMTGELQAIRNTIEPGDSRALIAKGINFGTLRRDSDGVWNTDDVEGLIPSSLVSDGPLDPPTLVICPFHQASAVISLRQFTNNAFNHHHGIQSAERFGDDIDNDADGVVNELTRADVTAATLYQAAMAVPGRVIPSEPIIAQAIWDGEQLFEQIGCTECHVAALPLENEGWLYTEPNPYNLQSDAQVGEIPTFMMDLTSNELPLPRLQPHEDIVYVPAYTDLKLHDITSNPYDPNVEPLNMQNAGTREPLSEGNPYFITRRLWGVANEPPYFHHGLYTTLRQAVMGHAGEALDSRQAYEMLTTYEQNALIEFLKSLQVLPPGTPNRIVNEYGEPVPWPPTEPLAQREGQ